MLKTIAKLEHKIGDKIYQLILDADSPLQDVKEVLFQFTKYVGQVEENVKSQQAAQADQKPVESKVESIPEQA